MSIENKNEMQDSVKMRLEQIGQMVLDASKTELYLSMRFLDQALGSLGYRMYLGTRTVACDGADILYHPNFLARTYEDNPKRVNRAYLHMLFHCIFRHMLNQEERNDELWNLACDIAVESVIDSLDVTCVKLVVSDERQAYYDMLTKELRVLTAEGIYRFLLRKQYEYQEFVEMKREFQVCDHSVWELLKDNKQEEKQQEQQSEEESHTAQTQSMQNSEVELQEKREKWEEISQKMQTSLETFARSMGAQINGLTSVLKVENRVRQDYREFLRKFAVRKEVMGIDEDEFDYGYYSYGMSLFGNLPLIEPLEYKEINQLEEFVIVIDTSGSCSGKLVKSFLQESYSILSEQQLFGKKMNVHIIQCDDEVQSVIRITNLQELNDYEEGMEIKGMGGTDYRPAFTYVEDLIRKQTIKKLKGLLYFTDGYGIYPEKRPSYDVAFVFLGEEYSDEKVPSWAMKLVVEVGGLEDEY